MLQQVAAICALASSSTTLTEHASSTRHLSQTSLPAQPASSSTHAFQKKAVLFYQPLRLQTATLLLHRQVAALSASVSTVPRRRHRRRHCHHHPRKLPNRQRAATCYCYQRHQRQHQSHYPQHLQVLPTGCRPHPITKQWHRRSTRRGKPKAECMTANYTSLAASLSLTGTLKRLNRKCTWQSVCAYVDACKYARGSPCGVAACRPHTRTCL